ncbi:hypothetical protein QBC41DRAFT_235495 [Cercophora samala]|uniref:Uncharacterized protein n=1 Tax=Cercophora samala TaxID=330535 RepID=A0AA39Z0N2_9PEZI|nr:hypothetical protein QBC41DRAFT_235495 [Cercophora samala]
MALVFSTVWRRLFLLGVWGLIIRLLPMMGGRPVPLGSQAIPGPQDVFGPQNTNKITETNAKQPVKRKRQRAKKNAVPEPPIARGDLPPDAAMAPSAVPAGSNRRRRRPAVSAHNAVPNAQSIPGLPVLAPAPPNYGAGVLNGHDTVSSMLGAQFASGIQPAPPQPSYYGTGVLNGHDSVSSMIGAQFASQIQAAPPQPSNFGAGVLNGHDSVSSMIGAQFASEVPPALSTQSNISAGFLNGHDSVSSMLAAQIAAGATPTPLPDLAATKRPSRKR